MDTRSFFRKTTNFFDSVFRELNYFISVRQHRKISEDDFRQYLTKKIKEPNVERVMPAYDLCDRDLPIKWKDNSEGLHVLIHGLNGHPSIWDGHLSTLQRESPQMDTFVPFVPLKGQCTLKEAADPILEKIKTFIEQNRGKPVILSGVSNGGRIAAFIEYQLRTLYPDTPIMINAIAAPMYGTQSPSETSFAQKKFQNYSVHIQRSLAFGSLESKQLLANMNESLNRDVKRKFVFFGSRNDWHVTHLGSTIPKVIHACEHHITQGYMHSGIVEGVKRQHLAIAARWIRENDS